MTRTMYAVLRISPWFLLLGGLIWAAQDAILLADAPPEFKFNIAVSAIAKTCFSLVGATAAYWLKRIVDVVVPGARG